MGVWALLPHPRTPIPDNHPSAKDPMPKVAIVTDTTASLPAGYAAAHRIAVVPQVVRFGSQAFREDVDLTYAEFIARLRAAPDLPGTAAPPPGELLAAYSRQLEWAQSVISLHPSEQVSGTVRSAQTARAEGFAGADIHILDTRTVAGNLGSLVQLAAGWAEAGQSAAGILAGLETLLPRGHTYFLVATLEYLQKGGRIGGAAALVGSVLQIKPILQISNGRVEPLEKVRTYHRAFERLVELVVAECPRSPAACPTVMHADDLVEAQRLAARLQAALGLSEIPILSLGASITTHAGPGALGVGFFSAA